MAGKERSHPSEHPNFSRGIHEVPIADPMIDSFYRGKVRDVYGAGDALAIITTDRTSAFDSKVCTIPGKGQALNLLSAFIFDQTADILPNHVISVPHPNVTVAHNVTQRPPVEVVVREYMAQSETSTSIYKNYMNGRRNIYGIHFDDDLLPNQQFENRIVTPTTKAEDGEHDMELTDDEARKIVDTKYSWGMWDEMKRKAFTLFDRGSLLYENCDLILVDTKFEFGVSSGELILIDEVLTPDSSRLWEKGTYQELFDAGRKPENHDKQIIRDALSSAGYKGGTDIPVLPDEVIDAAAAAYEGIYTRVSGKPLPDASLTTVPEIQHAVLEALRSHR